jgi:hypothetical protein
VHEPIFCDRIEIPMKLVIDVTDEPEGLTEETAELLRKLVSEDETERAMAQEDFVMAFIMQTPAACTMSCSGDSAEALENLQRIHALDAEPDDEITDLAAEGHYAEERKRRKAASIDAPNVVRTGPPASGGTVPHMVRPSGVSE